MIRYLRTLPGKISASILLFSVLNSAAFAWGYSGSQTISSVYVDLGDSIIMVYPAAPWANPDGCPYSGAVVIAMTGNYKDLEAIVLTAYAAGRPILFGLNGCSYTPGGNAPLVTGATGN